MSDERLGTNPLEWVTPDAAPGTTPAAPPAPGAGDPQDTGPMASGFFLPADSAKEDTMGKGKIKIKQTMETAQAVAYLKDLVQSLESGVIRAENEEGTVVLGVSASMDFELKVARKKDKAKLAIEMEWTDDGSTAETLKISDGS